MCVSDGTCEVQSGRRTVCSHCRLKRCLDVGMSKNGKLEPLESSSLLGELP